MTTLLALKNREAKLRTLIHDTESEGGFVDEETLFEYQTVIDQLVVADKKLMKPVDICTRCKWCHED